eukprot:4444284-Pyramimonas_sp.AAC.1
MDFAMFPNYDAQTTGGGPRVRSQPENPSARTTADDFYMSQHTREAGYEASIPGQVPHYGYLAAPMDQDVDPRGPEL